MREDNTNTMCEWSRYLHKHKKICRPRVMISHVVLRRGQTGGQISKAWSELSSINGAAHVSKSKGRVMRLHEEENQRSAAPIHRQPSLAKKENQ